MQSIGTIQNIDGFRTWRSASICYSDEKYFIVNNDEAICLTDYLEDVNIERHSKTSIGGVLARTALGGIAGSNWKKGNAGISGAAVGLGSSLKTESQDIYITLKLVDGDFIHGKTDSKTASLLENICGQSSGEDRVQKLEEEKKYSRYLDDAPRTYYEVKEELTVLEEELKEHEHTKNNGPDFSKRDNARQQYIQLKKTIDEKRILLEDLEYRAKAIKAFGNFDTFLEQERPLRQKYKKLENTLYDVKLFHKWHFYVLIISILAIVVADKNDAEMVTFYSWVIAFFAAYYPIRFLFRLVMHFPRKQKLLKLQKEYDEKYGLNNIEL